jgi:hypothetical protein
LASSTGGLISAMPDEFRQVRVVAILQGEGALPVEDDCLISEHRGHCWEWDSMMDPDTDGKRCALRERTNREGEP